MKIDVMLFPALVAPNAVSRQSGAGLSFEDLLPQQDDDPAGTVAAAQQVFSFNALGVLGAGGHPDGGMAVAEPEPAGASAVQTASAASASDVPPGPAEPLPKAGRLRSAPMMTPAGSGLSAPQYGAFSSPNFALRFAGAPENAAVVATPRISGARLLSSGPAPVVVEGPESEGRAEEKQSLSKFVVETRAETTPRDFNVTIAENDGVLHIIAAAPNLPEEVRHKIRALADDVARDAGVNLGHFFLNGHAVLQFTGLSDRRPSWHFQT